jgi:WD40 repeat protein
VSYDAWKEGKVAPTVHQIDVVAPPPRLKLEPVSARLKAKLIHPRRGSNLVSLKFSPDGKRLLAASFPRGGVIQVWDVETGRQLTKIDSASVYYTFQHRLPLTSDWKTLFTNRQIRKFTPVERNGKRLIRCEFDSQVTAWDLDTGQRRENYRHTPPRNILSFDLSEDGSTLLTNDELSGEWEIMPKQAITLWNVKTKQCQQLCEGVRVNGVLSPDGKTAAVTKSDDANYGFTTGLSLFDVATAKERRSIPVAEKFAHVQGPKFTADSRVLVGCVRASASRTNLRSFQSSLKFWDVASGRELASFSGDKNADFREPVFSATGKVLYSPQADGTGPAKVHVFESSNGKLIKTVVLGPKQVVMGCAFCPDDKWLAVACQPVDRSLREMTLMILSKPEEIPQPRVYLIDLATGEIAETLIAPQGVINDACFSPDGKTLATTGHGAVLLWDMTRPPGAAKKE